MSYRVDKIMGKGYGLLAVGNIEEGGVILVDAPLYSGRDNLVILESIIRDGNIGLLDDFHPKEKADVDGMTWLSDYKFIKGQNNKAFRRYNRELLTLLFIKIYMNSFTINKTNCGLFNTARYFNHSCSPNVVFSYIGGSMVFKADTNIMDGEELTICYTDEGMMTLEVRYGFICGCEMCTGG